MALHGDEAPDALLEVSQAWPSYAPLGVERAQRSWPSGPGLKLLCSAIVVSVIGVCWWGNSTGASPRYATTSLRFERKDDEIVGVEPDVAVQRYEKRQRLIIEKDLSALLKHHTSKRGAHHMENGKYGEEKCFQSAENLFDEVAAASSMEKEFQMNELLAFKHRFASAMEHGCKETKNEAKWVEAAGREFEQQKPLMTAALAASINEAGLGFQADMQDWLLHESVAKFESRLGLLPSKGQKDVLKRGTIPQRGVEQLPENFRAEQKWPTCQEEILKIHNQGHCGSCWAFGGLASVDARMCIASNGTWSRPQDILSRLHVTSCAPGVEGYAGHDGCQGGLPHWAMDMMARTGVVSSSCLPYYIGGEGVEHFEHQDAAPPCETHCQNGYGLSMVQDAFSSSGVANYDWLTEVHGDADKIMATKMAIYQEGPVSFAFYANSAFMGYKSGVFSVCTGQEQANHAVYAFGWGNMSGVEFIEASNSWGTLWGADGHFRIHPRCVTDVTIPGTIETTVVSHVVGDVDHDVKRDEDNDYWPWPKPDECPFKDGCVTDMEANETYVSNELCVSKKLNGKKIVVVEFDLEWGYDVLTVNGDDFSGKEGAGLELDKLNGLLVSDAGIRFQSDFSVNRAGFKICETMMVK